MAYVTVKGFPQRPCPLFLHGMRYFQGLSTDALPFVPTWHMSLSRAFHRGPALCSYMACVTFKGFPQRLCPLVLHSMHCFANNEGLQHAKNAKCYMRMASALILGFHRRPKHKLLKPVATALLLLPFAPALRKRSLYAEASANHCCKELAMTAA